MCFWKVCPKRRFIGRFYLVGDNSWFSNLFIRLSHGQPLVNSRGKLKEGKIGTASR
ncbi:hypothetical protein PITCH_A1500024 [uncultured Desulfobacterium sp.]|uniref:Uncharacterized protein n=1 Tax=uncultured Desulfobacterium sp. TaxID=201089 RepID=A0A445MTB0_9BACT|nr:hypothetical protein PITCH_A1500024 [uncultured Desulfobacterium sp.]